MHSELESLFEKEIDLEWSHAQEIANHHQELQWLKDVHQKLKDEQKNSAAHQAAAEQERKTGTLGFRRLLPCMPKMVRPRSAPPKSAPAKTWFPKRSTSHTKEEVAPCPPFYTNVIIFKHLPIYLSKP